MPDDPNAETLTQIVLAESIKGDLSDILFLVNLFQEEQALSRTAALMVIATAVRRLIGDVNASTLGVRDSAIQTRFPF